MPIKKVAYRTAKCDFCNKDLKNFDEIVKLPLTGAVDAIKNLGWEVEEGVVYCKTCKQNKGAAKENRDFRLSKDQLDLIQKAHEKEMEIFKTFMSNTDEMKLAIDDNQKHYCKWCGSVTWDKDKCCIHCESEMYPCTDHYFWQKAKKIFDLKQQ